MIVLLSCNPGKQEKFKIGFSQPMTNDLWRQTTQEEMSRQLLLYEDLELIFKDAKESTSLQIEQIQELVDQEIDLLIVSPNEYEHIGPTIESVYQRGIPVILLDRKIYSDQYTAFVGADNRSIGREVARYISIEQKPIHVLELYELLSTTAFLDRHEGFREELSNYPWITVDSCRARSQGKKKYIELLQSKTYDYVFGANDVAAYYGYQIADSLGLADSIAFIGIDGLPGENGGLSYVGKGILKASFLYPTGADVAIDLAANILHQRPFEKENILQSTVLDGNNVKLMQLQANKLNEQQVNINKLGNKLDEITSIFKTQKTLTYLFAIAMIVSISLGVFALKALIDKKKTFIELKEINEKVLAYSKEADEANQQKLTFFTNISHEFRTPLTLILSPIEEMLNRKDLSHVRNEHQLIKKNTLRLLRLVVQILDFRKIEMDKAQIRVSNSDLIAFVHDIVNAFSRAAEDKGVKLKFNHDGEISNIWFDESMFDKVMFNLLSNALKFTPKGGSINVKMEHNKLEDHIKIIVEDTGAGMTEEDLANVFNRFYQGDQNRSLGSGIGLSLSKEIIQLHGGQINVQSIEKKGTRFEIKLKTGKDHFQQPQIKNATEVHFSDLDLMIEYDSTVLVDTSKNEKLHDQSILLIEDNLELRHYLKEKLESQYRVIEAETVKEGIEAAFEEVPDLIVCDVMLKKESGLDIIRTLKDDVRSSHIPIIVLTAKASVEEKLEGIKLGADEYMTKPFNFALLSERIKTLLLTRKKLRDHYISALPLDASPASPVKLDKKFVNDFGGLIEENISNPNFGVNEICRELGLSRNQLYRKVKAILGYSVNDYINSIRLKKAQYLLASGEYTISEIAHMVGFSSASYFSTAFKSHFGMSPSEYA